MQQQAPSYIKYVYLVLLSLIWGSSFILIKKALGDADDALRLTPVQVGTIRIMFAGVILLVIGLPSFLKVDKKHYLWLFLSGIAGTFFPAFLFAYAQTEIDSAVSGILNSTVPIITLLLGAMVFGIPFRKKQLVGVLVGLLGALCLVFTGMEEHPDQNYAYAGLVLVACMCYALNVNIIKRYLHDVQPLAIATGNFVFITPMAAMLWLSSGGLEVSYTAPDILESLGYMIVLAVFGTVTAKLIFNKLVQMTSPVFASSVTYLMPVVGLMWGMLDGERFSIYQGLSTLVILFAVILVTTSKKVTMEEIEKSS